MCLHTVDPTPVYARKTGFKVLKVVGGNLSTPFACTFLIPGKLYSARSTM